MDPFIAQIMGFGGNFAPRGWAFCNGQLLPIASNSALFSILGTTYGGDGRTTFALPDLRGRSMLHVGGLSGTGPGLSTYRLGQHGGVETVTLNQSQMPAHSHPITMHAETKQADQFNPQGRMLAITTDGTNTTNIYTDPDPTADRTMASQSLVMQNAGGSLPHENRSPYLGINIIIALVGVFPSRS